MIEFYLKLKEEKIPKVMLTTEISHELKERGDRLGIDAWMPKPQEGRRLKLLDDVLKQQE